MREHSDPVLGHLIYDFGWTRDYQMEFWGRNYDVRLVIPCDDDSEIETEQREAFRRFEESRTSLLCQAQDRILFHYQRIAPERRTQVGPSLADRMVPMIAAPGDIAELVTPKELLIQQSLGSGERLIGLLFDCTWDPDLGLAVKIVDEEVIEVGPQDIIL